MRRLSRPAVWLPIIALLIVFAGMFLGGGPESQADRTLLLFAQRGELVPAARLLTHLGSWTSVIPITLAAAAWLLFRGARRRALLLIGILLSERGLIELLKELFDRVRPDPHGRLVEVNSLAFPSGHSANAITLGLALALLVAPERRRGPAVLAALLFAALIGLTRPVLGVHWPSDVMGGWALGAAWTLLLVRLFDGPADEGTSAPRPH